MLERSSDTPKETKGQRRKRLAREKLQGRYVSLPAVIAHYNRRFDEGVWWPAGTGMFLTMLDPCAYCGTPNAWTWDHLEPRSRIATPRNMNAVRACESCNLQKATTGLVQYLIRSRETPT